MSSGYSHVIPSTFNSEAEQAKKDNLPLSPLFSLKLLQKTNQTKNQPTSHSCCI